MKATRFGRFSAIVAFAFALVAYSIPAGAQTGQIKGKVIDGANKPIEGAVVVIEDTGTGRKFTVKTNVRGDYLQLVSPGSYKVTASHGGLTQTFDVKVGGDQKEVNFQLKPGGSTGEMSAADKKKQEELINKIKATFAEGAQLTNEGKYDEAIAKFNEVIAVIPKCFDCYNNIGTIHSRKQEWDLAEAAFKKAIEANPDSIEAYNGLANVYNAQKKYDEAKAMSAEATKRAMAGAATGGGNAAALYNAAVIAWNGNDFTKAHELLQQAVKIDANHAESHFMLGRVLINLGKLGEAATEFETYLKLAPTGPNAKEAQSNFDALKAYRK